MKLKPELLQQLRLELGTRPDADLARQYGVTRSRVSQLRNKIGIARYASDLIAERRAEREKYREERRVAEAEREARYCALVADYLNGMTLRGLAEAYGIGIHTVQTILVRLRRKIGLERRLKWHNAVPSMPREQRRAFLERRRTTRYVQLRQMWAEGATNVEMSQAVGLKRDSFQAYFYKLRQKYPQDFPKR